MHNLVLPLGGIITGSGVLTLLFGFEADTGGGLAQTFSQTGYTGLDQVGINSTGWMGIGMIAVGVLLMVGANATAWKKTDGY